LKLQAQSAVELTLMKGYLPGQTAGLTRWVRARVLRLSCGENLPRQDANVRCFPKSELHDSYSSENSVREDNTIIQGKNKINL